MKMKALVLTMVLLGVLCLAAPCLAAEFTVYCARGKIEVDMRDEARMKADRGGDVKVLGKFQFKMDADNFAKKLGGVGAQCQSK